MGFAADWLALREPADRAARDAGLMAAALRAAGPAPVVVDLGCGTGAMMRAMAAAGAPAARWRLVDHDRALLDRALAAAAEGRAEAHPRDLGEIEALPLADASLVTASALLDLVSRDWLQRLARRLASEGLSFLAVLSYDGRMDWDPPHDQDAAVAAAFDAHQRGDKGFGPALGPEGAAVAAQVFRALGYRVATADSSWRLTDADAPLQEALLRGIAEAAGAAGAAQAGAWLQARLARLGRTRCRIGHTDLLALAPDPAPPAGG